MTDNSDNFISYNFLFTIHSIFLSENILDATKKKEIAQLFMSQTNRLGTLVNTSTHISTITAYVTERQVQKEQEYPFQ
jgi:hypothetical protein